MKRFIAVLICAFAFAGISADANAKPHKKRHHHRHHHVSVVKKHHHHHYRVKRYHRPRVVHAQASHSDFGGFSSFSFGSDVVSRARAHIGQTARQVGVRTSLWCSAFLRKVTGARGVDDRAKSWEAKQHIAPQVGAVVTMGRGRRGGHVGVVSGFTDRGDPIVISGNHGNRVAESVYPRGRIRAWVDPNS